MIERQEPGRQGQTKGRPLEILVVASDEDMRTYVQACLEAHGTPTRVTALRSLATAGRHSGAADFDLVVADLDGSGPDGPALLGALLETLAGRRVPLIVLADEPAGVEAGTVGPDCSVLGKPFNARVLCGEIDRMMALRASRPGWDACPPEPPGGAGIA